ncbi:GPCR fungal pheromone mating factor [Cantharellus anzutake]|uniref:GPCR fungal pheromone mating factor n=1 Tax=Cantharellus anzutake TaxID=1750568 RepID=UPI0019030367|nr:GPCR fungal pheromone mating factor [Cantharellus anzutake]KAF8331990.1 GPCR fungal pheromone mating factor [Cantharellus anzutake]
MARYELTALSYIAAVLVIIPSPSQWRAGNISILSIIAWLFILNVYRGTNTIIWANNVRVVAPVYCDIGNLLWVAAMWGLPASAVCLTRYLASVTSPTHAIIALKEERKRFWFEMTMCVFLSFVYTGLHYVVEGRRFDILEDLGCQPHIYLNWLAIWLVYAPSVALSFISAVYVGIAVYRLVRYRATCRRLLADSPSGLTNVQYLRFMALGLVEVVTDLGMNLFVLISDLKLVHIQPSVSWTYVHADYGQIRGFTNAIMTPEAKIANIVASTIPITSAFAFFFLFAFGQEAIADYKRLWAWVKFHIFRIDRSSMVGEYEHTTPQSSVGYVAL